MSEYFDFICSRRCTVFLCITLGMSILVSSCASQSQNTTRKIESSAQPSWLLNPEKHGYQSVVAAAPRQDRGGHDAQYRVAVMKARQELAQMVRVHVKSVSRYETEDRSGQVSNHSDIETSLSSRVSLNLDEAHVIAEWTDPKTGELYIWLVVPQ